jgi:hypothetical protein
LTNECQFATKNVPDNIQYVSSPLPPTYIRTLRTKIFEGVPEDLTTKLTQLNMTQNLS